MVARRALLAALVVGLLAGAIWLMRGATGPSEVGRSAAPVTADGLDSEDVSTTQPTAPPTIEGDREQVDGASEPTAAPTPTEPSPPAAEFRLHGTVEVLDARGVALAPVDGSLRLKAWDERKGVTLDCEFRAGRWSVVLENPTNVTHVTIASLEVGGRRLYVEAPRGDIPVPADGRIDIRARERGAAVLRVVDARSGFDLDGVVVARCPAFPFREA